MLCRLVLIALGVIPLFVCISFLIVARTSWYRLEQNAYWRERIRNNLGLDVVFSSIEMLAPDRFVIRQLVCIHPETQNRILHAESVHGMMATNGWALRLEGTELDRGQCEQAIQIIHDSFLCRPHKPVSLLKLDIPELTIRDISGNGDKAVVKEIPNQLYRVVVEYGPSLQTSELKIRFGLSVDPRESPVSVGAVRHHVGETPITEWGLDTGLNSLPCSLVSNQLMALRKVGANAKFIGRVECTTAQSRWSVRGKLLDIDWGLLTSHFGSPMMGKGSIEIERSLFQNQRLEFFEGVIRGGQVIQSPWLRTAPIPMEMTPRLSDETRPHLNLNMQAMSMYVRIDSRGVHSQGVYDEDHHGKIAAMVENRYVYSPFHTTTFDKLFDWMAKSQTNFESEEMAKIASDQLRSTLTGYVPIPASNPPAPPTRLSDSGNLKR